MESAEAPIETNNSEIGKMKKPTKQTAIKILELLKHGLVKGKGIPEPGKMCVEAAVCYAMGLPHDDNPPCVAPAVRAFKIALNDSNWSSNAARAKGLQRIAIAQLGSENIDQVFFAKELARLIIQRIVSIALWAAAKQNPKHAAKLEDAAVRCEKEGTKEAATFTASTAADAAYAATYAAAYAATYAAAYAAYAAYAGDEVLFLAAEIGVEVLQICKSPGCKWLSLIKD
jgi:hypothetical protein